MIDEYRNVNPYRCMPRIKKRNEPMTPEALNPGELTFRDDSALELRWVLVDDLVLLEGNSKLHDIGLIADSITENGFRDPPSWDANLNNGAGGIVEGNGRSETLKMMQDQGIGVPRGVATNSEGKWAIPVLFGVDARSEAAAKKYSIEHNALTLAGSSMTALDASRLYDKEAYVKFLEDLEMENALPLTVSSEDLELIKKAMEGGFNDQQTEDEEMDGDDGFGQSKHQCPNCGFTW